MKKCFIRFINIIIYIFSFLFLLSTCFKIASFTVPDNERPTVIAIWIIGLFVAIRFTRPLYQAILAWRPLLKEWLQFHHPKQ